MLSLREVSCYAGRVARPQAELLARIADEVIGKDTRRSLLGRISMAYNVDGAALIKS